MADKSKTTDWFKEKFESISESLNDQEWFQELRTKWEELDSQSREYLKWAFIGAGSLFAGAIVIHAMLSSIETQTNLNEKLNLLTTIQSADRRAREIRGRSGNSGGLRAGQSWRSYIESTAGRLGIAKSNIKVFSPKPGKPGDVTKESLIDLALTKVNIKQVVNLAFRLETGATPVKLRNIEIKTIGPKGYLDAKLAISGFEMNDKK